MIELRTLLQGLDEAQARYSRLDAYYFGRQPLAFLSPEAKEAIGDRLTHMTSNIPRLAINSLTERLRVTGFSRDGVPDPDLWRAWLRNDLDQLAPVAHREALTLGSAYVIVWADEAGRPTVSVESAKQVATVTDPATRQVVAGVKRWESQNETHAVLYSADEIVRYRARSTGATTAGFEVVDRLANPMGTVPVVGIVNADRLLSPGASELDDLIPLTDGLVKTLTDMLVTSEFYARPRRWATGIELAEDDEGEEVSPFPPGDRLMVAEPPEARFGQLAGADLSAYEGAVNVLLGQIQAVGSLPSHYVGQITDQPASADALRAAEASLAARAAARQATFGRAWEQVARLMHAVATGADPSGVDVSVSWADPTTRSIAQEADAVVKLHAAGIIPTTVALRRLGYSDAEVEEVRAARRVEALDSAGVDLSLIRGDDA